MIHKQCAIVHTFERAAATTVATACTAEQLGLRPGLAWGQLVSYGVLRCPGEGRYFLDIEYWQRLRVRRRRLAVVLVGALLLGLVLLLAVRMG